MKYLAIHHRIDSLITPTLHKANTIKTHILGHRITTKHTPLPTAGAILGIMAITQIKAPIADIPDLMDTRMVRLSVAVVVSKIASGHQVREGEVTNMQNSPRRRRLQQAVGYPRTSATTTTRLDPRVKSGKWKVKTRR